MELRELKIRLESLAPSRLKFKVKLENDLLHVKLGGAEWKAITQRDGITLYVHFLELHRDRKQHYIWILDKVIAEEREALREIEGMIDQIGTRSQDETYGLLSMLVWKRRGK